MKPYWLDLRERVLADCDAGMPAKQVAQQDRVCPAWVRRLKRRRRETGSIEPKAQRHGPLPRRPEQAGPVAEVIEKTPDATLREIRLGRGLPLSLATLWRLVRDLGLTSKKKSLRAAEQDRPDVKGRRDGWPAEVAGVPAESWVFLDETSASTNMTRRHGRSRRGKRLVMAAPHGHWKTTTLVDVSQLADLTVLILEQTSATDEGVRSLRGLLPTVRVLRWAEGSRSDES
ncbi:hypothetical protein EP7_005310 [Isosphaeraceae bacterium EP7]